MLASPRGLIGAGRPSAGPASRCTSWSSPTPGEGGCAETCERHCGRTHVLPDGAEVPSGHHRVGREAVDLGLVQEQEERSVPAHPVLRVTAVEAGDVHALVVELLEPGVRAQSELVQLPELDRLGGAGLGAGWRLALLQPVVAQGALEGPTVLLA